jgi:hypothetical protein
MRANLALELPTCFLPAFFPKCWSISNKTLWMSNRFWWTLEGVVDVLTCSCGSYVWKLDISEGNTGTGSGNYWRLWQDTHF